MSLTTSTKNQEPKLIQRFMTYVTPYKGSLGLGFCCGVLGGIASVVTTYYLGRGIDRLVGQGQVDFTGLTNILGLLLFFMLVTSLTQFFTQFFANRLAYHAVNDLRQEAIEKLDTLPLRFFDQTSQGSLISRFTNDMDNISIAVTAVFAQIFQGLTTIILALIFMGRLSGWLTLTVLITTPLIFLTNYLVAKNSQKTFQAQQEILGQLSGYAQEGILQQKIVRAFSQEKVRQATFEDLNHQLYIKGQKAQFASSLTNPCARFVDHLAYVLIALIGGLLYLKGNSGITIGIISSFTIYAGQFSKPFIELSGLMTQLQTAQVGLSRSFAILDEVPAPTFPNEKVLTHPKGAITFQDVDFSYTPDQPLIQNFNLQVNPGERVAIVGKTGAGKSTLVNLLMRFYEVDDGAIFIDGENVQHSTRDSLRQNFGMVLQDTWLFDASIAENLKFGRPEARDEEMIAACKEAHIHHFIQSLPEGYQTILGQGGLEISNGQRQLLTIARTMLKNPPLLILDEATSSVDTLTEKQIQDGFNKMMAGKTSFIIAHRLSTIQNAHQILVMDHGQIVESGNHQELLAKGGAYYQLYQAQFNQG
ncbi:ABC transporter ATP-binding protein [Enterococcus nangangensis]|uniref:ABC transporter ATP-binding protein n=1 Tax=Enterococcus nangangensis TaxID=2559926 RepID=UPI001FE80543|nr:ABC transporter ATP-binding protein [Enterococcus nangangensis]